MLGYLVKSQGDQEATRKRRSTHGAYDEDKLLQELVDHGKVMFKNVFPPNDVGFKILDIFMSFLIH